MVGAGRSNEWERHGEELQHIKQMERTRLWWGVTGRKTQREGGRMTPAFTFISRVHYGLDHRLVQHLFHFHLVARIDV